MTIDTLEISRRASAQIAEHSTFSEELCRIFRDPEISGKTMDLFAFDPILLLATSTKKNLTIVQMVCAWYWQMGRLYGQQETTDAYLSGLEKSL